MCGNPATMQIHNPLSNVQTQPTALSGLQLVGVELYPFVENRTELLVCHSHAFQSHLHIIIKQHSHDMRRIQSKLIKTK